MLILFFSNITNLYVPLEKDIEFLDKFGKRLKQLREEKKITQAQLSFEADIQISQISRIERGQINTTIVNLKLICKILDVSLKDFFDFEY
jgi:transcriptional regulator with XRE-family HTH domain